MVVILRKIQYHQENIMRLHNKNEIEAFLRKNVAPLGNIVTHPGYRSRGYAKSVTAQLCRSLSEHVNHIGLNVKANNAAAIALYHKLGFEITTPYYECTISAHSKR